MIKEAEKYASEDAKRKERVEVRNHAETAVFNMEKFLRDYGDKLPEDAKTEAQKKMAAVNAAKDGEDVARLRSVTEELNQFLQGLGARMYENVSQTPPPASGDTKDKKGEGVVDAEFTEQ